MNTLSPYLFFDGNCAEAMRFYAQVLGGKLDLMRHDQAPADAQHPQQSPERILHARLSADGTPWMVNVEAPASP